ncbi:hypothetical protein C1645_737884 [Glomus cerebriforme]|uniref:Uncharacterized protein n=1 Tax=Glomus cerebriforme TaxID=658196 RepID=A0A397T0J9_9GLOM|nr:hypothetical protein C1645_737884 [Glomus cerebriforme]
MDDAQNKKVNINAFVSDSAGEYVAARWNSYYFCFYSILKTQATLKFLSAKFNPECANIIHTNGIPNIEVDKRSKRSNGEHKLPDDITDSINNSKFWAMLFSL